MTVRKIKSIGDIPYPIDVGTDALSPLLTAGAALGITGDGPAETAAWLQRTSTSDGPTTVKSIHGRTVRWNQLVSDSDTSVTVPSGHKYVARIDGTTTLATSDGTAITVTGGTDNVFDLTVMFGAGSEPSTIEEFTALYPLPYYPYDEGTLLPVNMTGIETTGFNQWDEAMEVGLINASTGRPSTSGYAEYRRAKNYIPAFPSTEYYFRSPNSTLYLFFYDAAKNPIVLAGQSGYQYQLNVTASTRTITTPANCRYIRFFTKANYVYDGTICINLSGPRNGEYEPYWKSERTIPTATYFPDGMRSAGTIYDELTSDAAVTRVGSIHIDAVTDSTEARGVTIGTVELPNGLDNATPDLVSCVCDKLETYQTTNTLFVQRTNVVKVSRLTSSNTAMRAFILFDGTQTMSGINDRLAEIGGIDLHYPITPTTTPIDPPLNMTYRTEQGGTERVMVPTGEQSAPPTLVTAQGYTAESLRDAALSAIAPVENGLASTNYGVGSYLVHGGQLCKVTTAIATGEAITIGTNVTATTVMAEVLSLTQ